MTIQEMRAVLKEAEDGMKIQCQNKTGCKKWRDCDPIWDFSRYNYRVKLVPREFWVNIWPSGGATIHPSKTAADAYNSSLGGVSRAECFRFVEVVDDAE